MWNRLDHSAGTAVAAAGPGVAALTPLTARVSVTYTGGQATGGGSSNPAISTDGRYVVFTSSATNLTGTGGNGKTQIYLRDRLMSQTYLISAANITGDLGNGDSDAAVISADGRFIAFQSTATNLVTSTTGTSQIFVRDRWYATTTLLSVALDGTTEGNGPSYDPSMSTDGRFVAFESDASNLVTGDTTIGFRDIFVRDRDLDQDSTYDEAGEAVTTHVSVDSGGLAWDGDSRAPSISSTGRFVAFESDASLTAGDSNGYTDVYLHDRDTGSTSCVSVEYRDGVPASGGNSTGPAISADGRKVAFISRATDLVPADSNGVADAFVRDLNTGATIRVSVSDGTAAEANAASENVAISADGSYVAFNSTATNLVGVSVSGGGDVFLRGPFSSPTPRTLLASAAVDGSTGNGASSSPTLSGDGRYTAYTSAATNLVSGDDNSKPDVFLCDARGGTHFSKVAPDPIEANQPLSYTLVLTTANPNGRTSLVVTDTVPAHTTYRGGSMSASPAGKATWTTPVGPEAGQVLTWTIPALDGPSGSTPAVTLTFGVSIEVPITNGTRIDNHALVEGNLASASTIVHSVPDLAVGKGVQPADVKTNQAVTYTISLTNAGTAIAAGVRITDALPSGAAFLSMVSGAQPVITSPVVVWSGLDVYPSRLLSFRARMPNLAGTYSNAVTATYALGNVSTGPAAPVVVREPPNLHVSKSVTPAAVSLREPVTYTVVVWNTGGSPAYGVRLTDALPSLATFLGMASGGEPPTTTSPALVWSNPECRHEPHARLSRRHAGNPGRVLQCGHDHVRSGHDRHWRDGGRVGPQSQRVLAPDRALVRVHAGSIRAEQQLRRRKTLVGGHGPAGGLLRQ